MDTNGEIIAADVVSITVTIKQLDGTTFTVQIAPTATVGDLKQAIERERNVIPERQRLIYRAQELKIDTNSLTNYVYVKLIFSLKSKNDIGKLEKIFLNRNNVGVNPYMYDAGNGEGMADPIPMHHAHLHHDLNVLQLVKLCRFVRIFAIMDFIFLILFGLTLSIIFFLVAALALAGYYGAKMLRRTYLGAYIICLVLEIAARAFFIYWYGQNVVSVILFVLMIFIELFVLRCVIQLYKAIPLLEPQQRDQILILNRVGIVNCVKLKRHKIVFCQFFCDDVNNVGLNMRLKMNWALFFFIH
ncbi:hypothetical protein RFI_05812 [Reticulomyxa filosa]|uniref:Ubiquitin-like domain-containing protein n=1 Tax=Reticulomyxa filosa TaxID=46433 RepID=X6NZJ6_RETFI|nr:hypothetical protein RFI_05812 [Reticulomyxa filosa]|eukprot:ETO31308.1 hypothetical protein RFI_05812 [Reticulomyxa filosa]